MKNLTQVSNDQNQMFAPFAENFGSARHGDILAANDANFDATHLSEPLYQYLVGQEDPDDLGAVLEGLAPAVPVGRAFSFLSADSKEQFQTDNGDDGDIREIGGEFKQIRRTGTQTDARTDNKGLTMVLDSDQGGDDPAVQQRAVLNLRNRLFRSELRRVIALADANDTAATSVNWGPANTTADPDKDILDLLESSGDARGLDSNLLVFGGTFIRRLTALRSKAFAGAFATGALNLQQLADFFQVEKVVNLKTRFQSSATAKSKILSADVYTWYSRRGAMKDDPSNIKRFVTGSDMNVYVEKRLKRTFVSVEHYSRIMCTSSIGIYKLPTTYTA
jgi:hypothetical protein